MAESQQYRTRYAVVGATDLGGFETRSGGQMESESAKFRPAGSRTQENIATMPTFTDLTVSRVFDRTRDQPLLAFLDAAAGVTSMTVTEYLLDTNRVPWQRLYTWSGTLRGVSVGDSEADSTDPGRLELTMSVTSRV